MVYFMLFLFFYLGVTITYVVTHDEKWHAAQEARKQNKAIFEYQGVTYSVRTNRPAYVLSSNPNLVYDAETCEIVDDRSKWVYDHDNMQRSFVAVHQGKKYYLMCKGKEYSRAKQPSPLYFIAEAGTSNRIEPYLYLKYRTVGEGENTHRIYEAFQCYKYIYDEEEKELSEPDHSNKDEYEEIITSKGIPISFSELIHLGIFDRPKNDRMRTDLCDHLKAICTLMNDGLIYYFNKTYDRVYSDTEEFNRIKINAGYHERGCEWVERIGNGRLFVDYDRLNQMTDEGVVIRPLQKST